MLIKSIRHAFVMDLRSHKNWEKRSLSNLFLCSLEHKNWEKRSLSNLFLSLPLATEWA